MIKGIKLKVLSCVLMCAFVTMITNAVLAVDTEILKTADKYFIYLSGENDVFEYYIEPVTSSVTEDTTLYNNISLLDANGNNIAVLDISSVTEDSMDMWYRFKNEKGTKLTLDFNRALTEADVIHATSITNKIDVEKAESIITTEIINNESTEVTRGAFKIVDAKLDEYTYKYYISKISTEDDIALKNLAMDSVNLNGTFEILQYTRKLKELVNEITKNIEVTDYSETVDGIIVQPKELEDKEEIVIWLVKEENGEVKETDFQFVTCTRVEKGKRAMVTVTLPQTYDNIVLFVVVAVSTVLLVFVLIRRKQLKENK